MEGVSLSTAALNCRYLPGGTLGISYWYPLRPAPPAPVPLFFVPHCHLPSAALYFGITLVSPVTSPLGISLLVSPFWYLLLVSPVGITRAWYLQLVSPRTSAEIGASSTFLHSPVVISVPGSTLGISYWYLCDAAAQRWHSLFTICLVSLCRWIGVILGRRGLPSASLNCRYLPGIARVSPRGQRHCSTSPSVPCPPAVIFSRGFTPSLLRAQDCHTYPLSGGAAAAAAQSRVVLLPLSHAP